MTPATTPLGRLAWLLALICAGYADASFIGVPSVAIRAASPALACGGLAADCAAFAAPAVRLASRAAASRRASASPVALASPGNPMQPGSLVAIVTPMQPNGDIDLEALRSLLRWHIECGTNGIVALGTTGEASTMSMDERASVLQVCQEELSGKLPLMVGTGTIDPKHVIEMNKQAIQYGADACLVVTPYYVKPTQQGMIQVRGCGPVCGVGGGAATVGLPFYLYIFMFRPCTPLSSSR